LGPQGTSCGKDQNESERCLFQNHGVLEFVS
jgi:hypothetical protein